MEQTALRPKSLPGAPAPGSGASGGAGEAGRMVRPQRRPHAARRRGRRLVTWLTGLCCAVVLVLAGIGLGTVGAGVIALGKLAEMRQAQSRAAVSAAPGTPGPPEVTKSAGSSPARSRAPGILGLEVVDVPGGPGALVVAVHVPGPGYTAGLVRGDVLLRLGEEEIDSAAELATTVETARPGRELRVNVRHDDGVRQDLTVVPGVVT